MKWNKLTVHGICVYICIYMYMYIYAYVYMCLYVCLCVCLWVCLCAQKTATHKNVMNVFKSLTHLGTCRMCDIGQFIRLTLAPLIPTEC